VFQIWEDVVGKHIAGLSILRTAFVAVTVLTAFASARAADLLQEIKDRGFIRIGTFSIPPESWVDISSGEWLGVDADFSIAIAKSLGVEYDPVILTHAALAPALQSGRVDVIAGLYKTPERQEVMAYNAIPFWYGVDVLVAKSDSALKGLPTWRARQSARCADPRRKARQTRSRQSSRPAR
jgi:ABC-type amino acid transport substrate-binding protein